jgi:DNA polymerase-3 subunit gamma/tau
MAKRKSPENDNGTGDELIHAQGTLPAGSPYVVLARKYRPETFDQLIGQDAMVTTLRNAFATDRIAQGYMLTGVRGIGKTTTARILARALNYAKPDLPDRPTVDMDGYGTHCLEIIQSRHPDVLEMDAASNTSIDNVREIIENARYKPITARYKVFIIDEVHMLSKSAFNALLKTLEEPPAHVKFIFATTEVRKVPVTVLSRCQRFDLRRIDVPVLVDHFSNILGKEGAQADDESLLLIARAAGGSVRDGLSILDQAIAMSGGQIQAAAVRDMLGLADRGRIFELLATVFRGEAATALGQFDSLHLDGADPLQILSDLANALHVTTRVKVVGAGGAGEALTRDEKEQAAALADSLTMPALTRAWQMLQKGLDEASRAPDTLAAAEMVLIRLAYASGLPSPDEVIRLLGGGAGAARAPGREAALTTTKASTGPVTALEPVPRPAGITAPAQDGPESFAAVIELAGERRDAKLKMHLEEHVSLVRFESGRLEIGLLDGAPSGLPHEIAEKLGKWTGRRWIVAVSREQGEPPVGEVRRAREAVELAELKAHPAVQAVLSEFPGAEIKAVRPLRRAGQDDGAAG